MQVDSGQSGGDKVGSDPGAQAVCTADREVRPSAETAAAPGSCLRKASKKAVVALMTALDVGPTTPEAAM